MPLTDTWVLGKTVPLLHVQIIRSKRTYRAGVEMSQDVTFPPSFWNVNPTSSQVAYAPKVNAADTFATTAYVRYAVLFLNKGWSCCYISGISLTFCKNK